MAVFGIYRTILALLVVAQHIGNVPNIGAYAVFGFYMLSGYLMTYVVQKNYGYSLKGIYKYGLNRFLRIYPIYWISALLSLVLIIGWGGAKAIEYHPDLYIPSTGEEVLKNVLIAFPYRDAPRLVPPAWALTVELSYYAMIGLGLSRFKWLTILWFAASVIYHLAVNYLQLNWNYRYFNIAAASLPFSAGALVYHYREPVLHFVRNGGRATHVMFAFVLLGASLNFVGGANANSSPVTFFYLNLVLNALILVYLVNLNAIAPGFAGVVRKLDGKMGDLSYPIYLIHFQAGILAILLFGQLGYPIHGLGPVLLAATLPVVMLLAWLLTASIEKPIEAVRTRVKSGKAGN